MSFTYLHTTVMGFSVSDSNVADTKCRSCDVSWEFSIGLILALGSTTTTEWDSSSFYNKLTATYAFFSEASIHLIPLFFILNFLFN